MKKKIHRALKLEKKILSCITEIPEKHEKEEAKSTTLYVLIHGTCGNTNEADPTDHWDRPDTFTEWEFEGICKKKPKIHDYRTLDVHYKLDQHTYYFVYAIYSTGDSFGFDDHGSIEIFDLYKTLEEAEACKDALEASTDFDTFIVSSTGKKIRTHVPWHGYFEHLDSIEIEPVSLRP